MAVKTFIEKTLPNGERAVEFATNYRALPSTYCRFSGLIFSEGEIWKEHRRFAISTLRDLGMGRNWIEDAILEEISELIMIFKSHDGKPFDPSTHLMVGVSNVICAMIFGQRFDHSDLRFQKLLAVFGSNLRAAVAMAPLQFFPALRIIPFGPLHNARKQFHRNVEMMMAFLRSLVAGYREKASNEKTVEAVDYIARFHDEKRKKTVANSLSTFTGKLYGETFGGLLRSTVITALKKSNSQEAVPNGPSGYSWLRVSASEREKQDLMERGFQ